MRVPENINLVFMINQLCISNNNYITNKDSQIIKLIFLLTLNAVFENLLILQQNSFFFLLQLGKYKTKYYRLLKSNGVLHARCKPRHKFP